MQVNKWYHVLNKTIYKADFTKQLYLQQVSDFTCQLVYLKKLCWRLYLFKQQKQISTYDKVMDNGSYDE